MINGCRTEKIRAELLDKYSIKKCDIEIIDGNINCDSNLAVHKAGSVTFKYPNASRLVEDTMPNTDIVLSDGVKNYYLGIDIDGALCTYETKEQDIEATSLSNIFVSSDGTLESQSVDADSIECQLIDLNGFTWNVGVEPPNIIYTTLSDADRKVYYRRESVKIDYLTDRIKIYYVINDTKYSLGEYMIINPKRKNDVVTASIMDLTCLIQRQRELTPVVFKKGTPYHDVLSYFIIKSGYTKINIEETDAVLQSDRVFDDTKNRLEWFNEVAKEINYTSLETDEDGYFVSKKYRQTTLSNVTQIYRIDQTSIISGDIEVDEDFWNVCNIVKCVHSNPNTPLLVSVARNDDPSDPFSTYSIGEVLLSVKIDNVADKQELDTIATKMLFEQMQVAQDITFNSLVNPTHKLNDVIQLFSPDLEGIFLESSWTIPLKAGSLMTHKMRRLVDVRSVVE